ncbi:MAG: hypothetical protein ACTSVV_09945 [Promethearchaeota archaeon]
MPSLREIALLKQKEIKKEEKTFEKTPNAKEKKKIKVDIDESDKIDKKAKKSTNRIEAILRKKPVTTPFGHKPSKKECLEIITYLFEHHLDDLDIGFLRDMQKTMQEKVFCKRLPDGFELPL